MHIRLNVVMRSFCEDSSSPQISAIRVGHVSWENDSLRNSPQNFHKNGAEQYQYPGSQNSLVESGQEQWLSVQVVVAGVVSTKRLHELSLLTDLGSLVTKSGAILLLGREIIHTTTSWM